MPMPEAAAPAAAQLHADQVAYWNGPGAAQWVARQGHSDAMLAPVAEAAIARLAPPPDARVLDIGCGCGATTLMLAARLPEGRVTGLDVSAPMLTVARGRGAGIGNLAWLCADAATHPFPPGGWDLAFSRFGVMFFGDPVAGFANLRRALRPGGRMLFACWRPLSENPWMGVPLAAATPHLPPLPEVGPEDPGPFAFADPARIRRILAGAGWTEPTITPCDVMLDLAAGQGLDAAADHATRIGAAARAMRDQPEEVRTAAAAAIRDALAPHATADGRVALAGAVWLVETTAPAQ
jgi:SAM-dependent methyltransferase